MPFSSPIPLLRLLDLIPPDSFEWISGEETAHSTLIAWIARSPEIGMPGDLLLLTGEESNAEPVQAALRGEASA
ncbi:MAG: hypothetical protein WBM17_03705, partial [Anaerolineales bacterium]